MLDFGGLLGYAPILPVSTFSPSVFVNRGGRIPAPHAGAEKLNFLCAAPLRGGFLSLGGAFRALGKGLRQTLE